MRRLKGIVTTPLLVFLLVPGVCCTPAEARPGRFAADLLSEVPNKRLTMSKVHPSGQDMELLQLEVILELDGGGRLVRREERQHRILTEHAVDEFGDPRIVHDVNRQTLEVSRASSTMVDGKEIHTQKNGINETLPFELEQAPAYSGLRETVVTHVGLERLGSTKLAFTISDKKPRPFPLHLEVPVAFEGPARQVVVQTSVPTGREVKAACLGCAAKPEEREQGGRRVLRWTLKDVKSFHDEVRHRPGHALAPGRPRLVISDSVDWQAAGKVLAGKLDAAIGSGTEVRRKAAELTEDAPTQEQRIECLVDFVRDAVGAVHYDMSLLGWEPATADEVLSRGYGNTLDRAVLLSALLGAAGLNKARPVLISRDRAFAEDVPSLAQFSEVWVRAWAASGQERWFATEGHPAGDPRSVLAGRWAFDPRGGLVHRIEGLPPGANLTALTAELNLGQDLAVEGQASVTLTGTASPHASLRASDKDPDGLVEQVAGQLAPGAKAEKQILAAFDGQRTSVDLEVEAGPLAWQSERFLVLPVADGPGFLADEAPELAREKRDTPLVLRSALVQRSQITWKLPKTVSLRQLPAPREVENRAGRFLLSIEREEHAITVTRELTLSDGWIMPALYGEFRELMAAARLPAGRRLVVERDLP